jgi:fructose-bisphosphate aldolase, class I
MNIDEIKTHLGPDADSLLSFQSTLIPKEKLHVPSPTFVDDVFNQSDRSEAVKTNLKRMFNSGRLAGTGYLSILPVDQGIEHGAGVSFAKNQDYFDPANIVELALAGGCNAVASTLGVLGMMSKAYADKIPFIAKLNHNELLSYPTKHDQIMFGTAEQAAEMGAVGVGATIYFGSEESTRQIVEVSKLFHEAHKLGLFTILWCYTRNKAFTKDGTNFETAADITGQANHLGVTLEADIIKQKAPETMDGLRQLNISKFSDSMYDNLMTPNPIDLTRYQVANCYMGRVGLINSGGASSGESDLQEAIKTAVINKRAGGMGLISGRKAFQRPKEEGVALLNAIQDVYLCPEVTIA